MTDKAYIVANKQQELEVLKKLEKDGFNWFSGRNPTKFFPSDTRQFPIVLFQRDCITWAFLDAIKNEEIVYDGRKEEKMYKVTQGFMNELIEWRDEQDINAETGDLYAFVGGNNISKIPNVIENWWVDLDDPIENNNRLIAIIQWLNGKDVFELGKPNKFIVRSENTNADKYYTCVEVDGGITTTVYSVKYATKFGTREEAQEWANSHQVVVEIDEEGNEVK